MEATVIHHKLDLAVRLIDTTNGFVVEERDVRFWKNDKVIQPISKGSGDYIFLNCGREDCELTVKVYDYDETTVSIRYEELDSRIPLKEVYLIPSEDTLKGPPVITFSGKLPGLESIQATASRFTGLSINTFDERKRIMTLFHSNRVNMDHIYYGLVNSGSKTFEPFVVVKELSEASVEISQPLREPFASNSPINRIVFGQVSAEGDYSLRVRDIANDLRFIVRYVVNGKVKFKEVDFLKLDGNALE